LLVGAQMVAWTLGGLYMTAVHIDIIHGDHFIRTPAPRAVKLGALVDPWTVAGAGETRSVRLGWLEDRPVWVVAKEGRPILFDAGTGAAVSAPTMEQIRTFARQRFTGREPLVELRLVEELPFEVRNAAAPLWRAQFGGWNKPTLYFSAATGELVSRRHELWRAFDFFWMLHIMDYQERKNVNNALLRVATFATAAMTFSGAWLLLFSFRRKRRGA
jgi:hypothetical protein